MRIKRMNWFVKLITFNWPIAITLTPFGIYVRKEFMGSSMVINHEIIHWKQQMEMLIIPFYLWYLVEWLLRLFINGRHAYLMIAFEQEAHDNQWDSGYLCNRKRFAWFKYYKNG